MISTDVDLIGPWVYKRIKGHWVPGRSIAIGNIRNGVIVAGTVYEEYTGANMFCHIAGDGEWADRRFLHAIFDYPFNVAKVLRITAPVSSLNPKSIRLVEKMGFTIEAKLSQAIPGGDLLLYKMFRSDCKYLGDRYGKRYSGSSSST